MEKILYIPHYPGYKLIKNRSFIIASQLSKYAQVYFVQWHIPNRRNLDAKFITQLKNFKSSLREEGDLNIINIPLLFWPGKSLSKYTFNEWMINSIIKKLDIDTVINAGMNLVRFPNIKSAIRIYDIVDDHLDMNQNLNIDTQRLKYLSEDIKCADLITAITEQVQNKVRERYGIEAVLAPNGIDLTKQELMQIPQRDKNKSSKIFGFIGNIHEKWVNMNLALDAFREHLIEFPNDIFRIIGDGDKEYIKALSKEYNNANIEFLGPISQSEIYDYFADIDIGVIPFHINSFTENSLPIKAIEHGCFDTPVVSTPINALRKLSYVHFGTTRMHWKQLYKKLRNENIHIQKDELEPYIWEDIVNKLYNDCLCNLSDKITANVSV